MGRQAQGECKYARIERNNKFTCQIHISCHITFVYIFYFAYLYLWGNFLGAIPLKLWNSLSILVVKVRQGAQSVTCTFT